jgi:hypothetical protein
MDAPVDRAAITPEPVEKITARAGEAPGPVARLVIGATSEASNSNAMGERVLVAAADDSPRYDAAVVPAAFQDEMSIAADQEPGEPIEEVPPPLFTEPRAFDSEQDSIPAPEQTKTSSLAEIRFEMRRQGSAGAEGIAGDYPEMIALPAKPVTRPEPTPQLVEWTASNLRYRRPYFEQVMLERHGLSRRPLVQLVFSAGRFFTTAAFLPEIALVRNRHDLFDHRAFGHPGSPLHGAYHPDEHDVLPRFGPAGPLPNFSTILAPEVITEPLEIIDALESTDEGGLFGGDNSELPIPSPPRMFDDP